MPASTPGVALDEIYSKMPGHNKFNPGLPGLGHGQTVPRVCHRVWYQGASVVPSSGRVRMQAFGCLNPGWQQHVWDAHAMANLVESVFKSAPHVVHAYHTCAHMHQRIDLFKYVLMYAHGGAYLDMDVDAVRPLDGLLDRFGWGFIYVSALNVTPFEALVVTGTLDPRAAVNNGIFLSPPGHALWKYVVHACATALRKNTPVLERLCAPLHITRTTGPVFFQKTLRAARAEGLAQPVVVLEPKYCEPYKIFQKRDAALEQHAYLVHVYALSWLPGSLKPLVRVAAHHYTAILGGLALFAAVLAMCILQRLQKVRAHEKDTRSLLT